MESVMAKVKSVLLTLLLSMLVMPASASPDDIVEKISRDSIITVVQPSRLKDRLVMRETNQPAHVDEPSVTSVDPDDMEEQQPSAQNHRVAGFRVQVFSDNNARTAKNEARVKANSINEAIPHYRTYVTYDAPYWRLKVGDFRLRADAEAAADEIKRLFPSYSREVRVVRDRINVKL